VRADAECVEHVAMNFAEHSEIHRGAHVWTIGSGHPLAPGGIVERRTGFDVVRGAD
jgi:hypothetical protein